MTPGKVPAHRQLFFGFNLEYCLIPKSEKKARDKDSNHRSPKKKLESQKLSYTKRNGCFSGHVI